MARILGETPSDQTTKIGFTVEQVAQFPRAMWKIVGNEYSEIDILMAKIEIANKRPPVGCDNGLGRGHGPDIVEGHQD